MLFDQLFSHSLAHNSCPNLVKGKTAPASEDAELDARELHAVRQLPIQAIQQQLNMLMDDAIIQDLLESTALLSLLNEREGEKKRRKVRKLVSPCNLNVLHMVG